ncbi:hypothetical protein [Kitasatospora sp. NPDC059327]|uniref:hypothetical protein n=1 Tax=Kitasatospora sp. NPDC059327 TaxID=3346803 RepID=UPI0036B224B5
MTVVFLVLLVPSMPTRGLRIQTSLAPVAMAVFCVLAYLGKHMEPAAVLAMYSLVVLAFPLGMLGHREELARRLLDRAQNGESPENEPPRAMSLQLGAVLTVAGALAVWVIM